MIGDRAKLRIKGDLIMIRKKWLICDRYGKSVFKVGFEQRKCEDRGSIKCDCKMEAIFIQIKKGSNRWLFEILYSEYNHPPLFDLSAYYEIRNMYKDEAFRKRVIDDKRVGIHVKQIYTVFKFENSDNPIIIRDIYNERQRIRRAELNSKIPISTLLTAFLERKDYENEFFIFYEAENGIKDDPLTHLFIAHDKHIDLLIENFEVLIIDLTYKINMFQMLLVNIVGMTDQNRLFFIKNMFIPGEKEKDYKLVFYTIRKMYDNYGIPYLLIFIIDVYPAEIAAMKCIFFNIKHILCIWYINCNILAKLKPLIKAQFDRENSNDVENMVNAQIISQARNKIEKLAEYLNVKWKEFKRYQMKAIKANSERLWDANWKKFRVKFEF